MTSAGLSLLFLVVYSTTNWLTSLRSDVGTWYYAWERWIPFVPLMIVPYMSIDAFFVGAPFLCRDRSELKTLALRITFAILVAGSCFLLFPLRLARERPEITGWVGAAFGWFFKMDQPFNLLPSLHITLRTILAVTYARHTRGLVRIASHTWFTLVGFSTVLTYQHHIVDVVGGFILAAICFYVFSAAEWRLPVTPNCRLSMSYALALALVGLLAAGTWPMGAWLIWPAAGLALVAVAYGGLGPGIFRKHDGRIPLGSRLVLAPILLAHYLSWLYYRRRCRAWDPVVAGVWIGRQLNELEARRAREQGVTAVLDLTSEFSETATFRCLNYRPLPVLDLTAPTMPQLREAVEFLAEHAPRGIVYVHCKVGYSRSAAVVGAFLLAAGHCATADEAMNRLRDVRPSIVIRPEAEAALRQFERCEGRPGPKTAKT